ncbi:FHA domain-containing protein [Stieleria sp.]|uniref:FHA domain-containing protein n=1 Tax=Stieleria sp. TaxID=2795976 RepID=UPI00356926D1
MNDQNDGPSSPTDLHQSNHDIKFVASAGHLRDDDSSRIGIIPDALTETLPRLGGLTAGGASLEGSRSIPATGQTALEFRVIRPGAPVRRLRLTGNRYTFGSGEGCSIRLDDESLRPMHAVLLRDAHRILMRAYSVPLECNGNRVTESVLRLGDIIRMGQYRFELLAAPESSAPRHASLETRESVLHERLTQLSQQWHARHAECEVRESRCDQRETELHGRETELWSRAESLQHRESHLLAQEAAVREIQETYAATQEELKSLRMREIETSEALQEKEAELQHKSDLLRERQAELERRQAEWQQREEQYAEHAAEAQRKLEQTQQQAQSASDAVGRMRDEFSTLSEQLTELRERHSELQAREKREQQEHERLRSELEAARDQAIDSVAESEAKRQATESELERVSADLQSTREELARIREESKQCQNELSEKLRATGQELQATREDAEQSRRAAEEEQAYNEKRIAELEERLAKIQENREESERSTDEEIAALHRKHASAEEARAEADEARAQAEAARQTAEAARTDAEAVAEELRENIRQLQENVTEATQEASQLRIDQEGANASIRQLELLVDQTKNNQSAQQESWTQECDQLRQTIEDLSIQLAAANVELGQLQSANEALSYELAQSSSGDDDHETSNQAVIDSEQFRILEQELDSARQEIERLRETHAETVSRLETERQESESALRHEIEQLRDEIASAQQTAEAHLQGFAQATDLEPANSPSPATEQFVESGENRWRLESEQSVEQSSHLYEERGYEEGYDDGSLEGGESEPVNWSQTESLSDAADPTADDPQASDATAETPSEGQAATDQSVSWHDELPEQAIDGAIDEIEHNVEQAISDYEAPQSESAWADPQDHGPQDHSDTDPSAGDMADVDIAHDFSSESTTEQESPLDWSAFMPGGDVQSSSDDDTQSPEQVLDQEPEQVLDQEPEQAEPEQAGLEANAWDQSSWQTDAEQSGEANDYEATQQWDGVTDDGNDSVSSGLDSLLHGEEDEAVAEDQTVEDAEPPAGSLAAMLIRDLAGDDEAPQEHSDANADEENAYDESSYDDHSYQDNSYADDVSAESAESEDSVEEGHHATFVMDSEIEFSADESDGESDAWSLESPHQDEPLANDATGLAESFDQPQDDLDRDAAAEEFTSQTALVSEHDTVVAADDGPEDDSIEAYMSRLLQRVQGEDQPKQPAPPAPPSVPVAETEQDDSAMELDESDEAELEQSHPVEPSIKDSVPLVPRSQAPELSRNLSAMRELANQSARNAVSRSIRIQARDTQMKAALKGGLALGFATMGIAAFIFVTWSGTIKFGLVGAFLVLAGVFGQEGYVLARDARRRLALADQQTAEEADDDLADE